MAENSIMQAIEDAKRAIAAAEPAKPAVAVDGDPNDPNTDTTPAESAPDEPDTKDTDKPEPTVAQLAEAVDDLKQRVGAIEQTLSEAKGENAALTGALQEATGTIHRLVAILRDPARAQAYARGETEPARPKADAPSGDVLAQFLALAPGSAEAKAFYKAHAAEIAARANAR